MNDFIPKSFDHLRNYSFSFLKKDLIAGLTIGVIALPLAMAFAIASGVGPEKGLYTAIIAGFLISFLGGSSVQIGGPTGAFVIVIYGIIERTGYVGLSTSLLIAALLLFFFGLFRLGSLIKYVPHSLITGFTTGIALIIFSSQIKDFFGLRMGTPPADFIGKWASYFHVFPSLNLTTIFIGLATLSLILLMRRFTPRLPWGIVSIVFATALCYFFQLPVATIASRFGEIPHSLPLPSIPYLSTPTLEIIIDGMTIALLGGIESLLSAVIGDKLSGGTHRPNIELIAQGVANFASLLFGGIPATGAIARTAANVKSGAQTPVAGMIHAATLLFIILYLAPLVSLIPLTALAAVLFIVAWNMSEAKSFVYFLKAKTGETAVLLSAFFLTIFVDIIVAIGASLVLAYFLSVGRESVVNESDP